MLFQERVEVHMDAANVADDLKREAEEDGDEDARGTVENIQKHLYGEQEGEYRQVDGVAGKGGVVEEVGVEQGACS